MNFFRGCKSSDLGIVEILPQPREVIGVTLPILIHAGARKAKNRQTRELGLMGEKSLRLSGKQAYFEVDDLDFPQSQRPRVPQENGRTPRNKKLHATGLRRPRGNIAPKKCNKYQSFI